MCEKGLFFFKINDNFLILNTQFCDLKKISKNSLQYHMYVVKFMAKDCYGTGIEKIEEA